MTPRERFFHKYPHLKPAGLPTSSPGEITDSQITSPPSSTSTPRDLVPQNPSSGEPSGYWDEDGIFVHVRSVESVQAFLQRWSPCVYRGEFTGAYDRCKEGCGRVDLPLFECTIGETCSSFATRNGAVGCYRCTKRQAPSSKG
jgi:hypothetical protein